MDDGSPALGVDFIIDPGESFGALAELQAMMNSAEAKIVAEAASIEKATGSMFRTVGPAATKELQIAQSEMKRVEKAGEALVRQMERQNAVYGKTRDEIRATRAEELALAAAQGGNTDLAGRIRAEASASVANAQATRDAAAAYQAFNAAAARGMAAERARASEQEATAVREAAHAYQTFEATARRGAAALRETEAAQKAQDTARVAAETKRLADEHTRLAAAVRGSHAAQEADAASLERLRASTDPLYAATKRLNDEIAESTRLYSAGVTPPMEYARQQQVLADRLTATRAGHLGQAGAIGGSGKAARLATHDMLNLSAQLQDIVVSLQGGQKPMTVFLQQGSQIGQIAASSGVGLRGMAASVWALAAPFAPLILGLAAAYAGFKFFQSRVDDDAKLKEYAKTLGLTKAEMKELKDVGITAGDVFHGLAKTIGDAMGVGDIVRKAKKEFGEFVDSVAGFLGEFAATGYAVFTATYDTVMATWRRLPAAFGDVFVQAVNLAIGAMNGLTEKAATGINTFLQAANAIIEKAGGKAIFGTIAAGQIAEMKNEFAGAGKEVADTFTSSLKTRFAEGKAGIATVMGNIAQAGRDRVKKQAEGIIADRTPKADRHAEQLARNAAALEAQIRNLYALADAYGVSGAAALIAEARVKAESQAIKQQADIEAAVDRQVRLAIAQRVSDGAKAAAATRDEARAQAEVNRLVAAGLVPASLAADQVRDRIADLPLLAAIEAAQQRGLKTEVDRATKALQDQRAARADLRAETIAAQFNSDMAAGRDQLATLAEELRLVGATDAARVHALATLKATQEAAAKQFDPAQAQAYIAGQVAIADAAERNRQAQDGYNASLTFTGDLFGLIDQNARSAAQGIADAFGEAGRAIGDALTSVTGYYAEQQQLQEAHSAAIRAAGGNQRQIEQENALFAARAASAQVRLYGNLASSAKGFFKEGSAGYKAMATAEKLFRAIELANAVKNAAVQLGLIGGTVAAKVAGDVTMAASDTARAGVEQTNSAASTAVKAVEAVVNAIRSLPFPANIAAGAATAAAIAALGVSIAGGFGGGKNDLPKANAGTGTVLGDTSAKSESLLASIDLLREIDDATLTVSRGMLSSLRSIENSIGGLSTLLVRAGDINASGDVTEGFKTDAVGSLLSKIPLVGGILGSLFGTKTKVVASGLFGDAQSLDDILSGGFDASYYSDVQKKKKLFGLTTSTKYKTTYGDADGGIEDQFTLLLRSFYETIGEAAVPLGQSLDTVQQRLLGFTVDIGKIDLQGLTGEEIQEKLEAVFGAAADRMAEAAVPGLARFQKVGEGAFETLVRVSSTVEQVDAAFQRLGVTSGSLGIDVDMAIAGMFDSVADFTSATNAYFETFYSDAERSAAETARMGKAFASLRVAMPETLAGFRALVDAQDLTTAAGQQMYATLIQLAPAFAELKGSLDGAASAAAIVRQREDLQRQLLELRGDTAAIRAAELAKLDAGNRALQEQIYAIQDAQEAAKAAEQLRDAWTSVGDSIMAEVKRIRGLTGTVGDGSFASLMGQFNAASASARGGDQDAAKSLPGLSQALLKAAADAATSRQELDRVQAQVAASLEATYGVVSALAGGSAGATSSVAGADAAAASSASPAAAANDDLVVEVRALRADFAGMRAENNSGHAATAGNTGRIDRRLEAVTTPNGGDAISVTGVAA